MRISPDTLSFIIAKAREYDAEVEPTDPHSGSNAADDREIDILEDTPENPTEEELVGAIDALSDEERIELLALAWVGRGDFDRSNWAAALQQARDMHDERLTSYLIETPLLADYLAEAAGQLGLAVDDYGGTAPERHRARR